MPQILKVDTSDPDLWDNIIKKTQKVLKGGGVIAFPTDTFYGLGADPYNKDAVNKIYEIKNRDRPSTLVDTTKNPVRLIRAGAISFTSIQESLNETLETQELL